MAQYIFARLVQLAPVGWLAYRETEDAILEVRGIMSGQIPSKSYSSARELFDELDADEP